MQINYDHGDDLVASLSNDPQMLKEVVDFLLIHSKFYP
jgi:hypothetical protein